MEALIEASRILKDATKELCREPLPIWTFVDHALSYVNRQIDEAMRGE